MTPRTRATTRDEQPADDGVDREAEVAGEGGLPALHQGLVDDAAVPDVADHPAEPEGDRGRLHDDAAGDDPGECGVELAHGGLLLVVCDPSTVGARGIRPVTGVAVRGRGADRRRTGGCRRVLGAGRGMPVGLDPVTREPSAGRSWGVAVKALLVRHARCDRRRVAGLRLRRARVHATRDRTRRRPRLADPGDPAAARLRAVAAHGHLLAGRRVRRPGGDGLRRSGPPTRCSCRPIPDLMRRRRLRLPQCRRPDGGRRLHRRVPAHVWAVPGRRARAALAAGRLSSLWICALVAPLTLLTTPYVVLPQYAGLTEQIENPMAVPALEWAAPVVDASGRPALASRRRSACSC